MLKLDMSTDLIVLANFNQLIQLFSNLTIKPAYVANNTCTLIENPESYNSEVSNG